jgi:hypothetical protein
MRCHRRPPFTIHALHALQSFHIPRNRLAPLHWPRQPTITTKQQNRWRNYSREQFLLSDGKRLKRSLGKWIHTTRNEWRFTTDTQLLYDHKTQRTATLQFQHR